MLKGAASKVMWVGRATVFLVGLAVILAVVFGVASRALAANGDPWLLGRANNAATSVTALVADVANPNQAALQVRNAGEGPALDLRVGEPGVGPPAETVAPMRVNSQAVVPNLNAAEVDGKDASEFAAAYTRTVVVSPQDGATPQQNGAALLEALDGIEGATAESPRLLRLEPGTYDLGERLPDHEALRGHRGLRRAQHRHHQRRDQRWLRGQQSRHGKRGGRRRDEVPHGAQHWRGCHQDSHHHRRRLPASHPPDGAEHGRRRGQQLRPVRHRLRFRPDHDRRHGDGFGANIRG